MNDSLLIKWILNFLVVFFQQHTSPGSQVQNLLSKIYTVYCIDFSSESVNNHYFFGLSFFNSQFKVLPSKYYLIFSKNKEKKESWFSNSTLEVKVYFFNYYLLNILMLQFRWYWYLLILIIIISDYLISF